MMLTDAQRQKTEVGKGMVYMTDVGIDYFIEDIGSLGFVIYGADGEYASCSYFASLEAAKQECERVSRFVYNESGTKFDLNVAADYMDNDIRKALHSEIAPCTPQEFFLAYCAKHEQVYGEEWELSKANPTY